MPIIRGTWIYIKKDFRPLSFWVGSYEHWLELSNEAKYVSASLPTNCRSFRFYFLASLLSKLNTFWNVQLWRLVHPDIFSWRNLSACLLTYSPSVKSRWKMLVCFTNAIRLSCGLHISLILEAFFLFHVVWLFSRLSTH